MYKTEHGRRYRERNREKERERCRRVKKRAGWKKKRDPLKEKASRTLRNAVAAGKVHKPAACEMCHRACIAHGHHHDYSKPLEVAWLCSICHGFVHRKVTNEPVALAHSPEVKP
jgi:hypothetical protein